MTAEFCRSEAKLCWDRAAWEHDRKRWDQVQIWVKKACEWEALEFEAEQKTAAESSPRGGETK